MNEEDPPEFRVRELGGQISGQPIREVTPASTNSLLQGPGVPGLPKLHFVVVGLENEEMAAPKGVTNRSRRPSDIGGHARGQSAGGVGEADGDRVRGIVTGGYQLPTEKRASRWWTTSSSVPRKRVEQADAVPAVRCNGQPQRRAATPIPPV